VIFATIDPPESRNNLDFGQPKNSQPKPAPKLYSLKTKKCAAALADSLEAVWV